MMPDKDGTGESMTTGIQNTITIHQFYQASERHVCYPTHMAVHMHDASICWLLSAGYSQQVDHMSYMFTACQTSVCASYLELDGNCKGVDG